MCETDYVKTLTCDELRRFIDTHLESDYEIIDVRQPEEYTTGHIPGAHLLPVLDIVSDTSRIPKDKDLIFYCLSGQRSHSASIIADDEKNSNHAIYHLEGGIMAWEGKTLRQYPQFGVFDSSCDIQDFMITAMKLEKGAHIFYKNCSRQFQDHKISSLFKDLSNTEKDHAKIIFEQLVTLYNMTGSFDDKFQKLSFDTIEGGKKLSDTLQSTSTYTSPCLEIIDIALFIEYSTFDLYRCMGNTTNIDEIKYLFLTLSQEEKEHMKTVIKGIELL